MLKSLVPKLSCANCKDSATRLTLYTFADGTDGHVQDGILLCPSCGVWFPIETELLELVPPPLIDRDTAVGLAARFPIAFAAAGVSLPSDNSPSLGQHFAEQLKQREHFDLYAESQHEGFSDYTKSRFIRASARRYVKLWAQKLIRPNAWILDIGCGTGNSSFPFAGEHTVIGFDISKKAIRRNIAEATERRCRGTTSFLVADGTSIPFRDQSFDYAHTFGALHHLPDPANAIRQIQRVLTPGGLHFAVENNASGLRGIFDLMMKLYPLWVEEAGAEPLISRRMVDEWCRGLPVEVSSETSIFLPPHLINLLNQTVADWAIEWSDRLFTRFPVARRHGGQLVFTIAKSNYA